ncbi:hypothetical protein H2199_004270 [Coniosporium tulheliwenetii]|uniref:Uncharacterized protein n=1 Tax=Coniosporium tulheliwenetii TaxID=3383036 RepID=A0ACC2Z8L3_9PEZI|nr:hypothetical protein H2199_004270 [Cladosporium sp. JES 115]
MIASVFLLASWLGCIIVCIAGMMMGRRLWIIAGSVTQILGSIVSASSFGYGQLIAGRVLVGIGNGFLTSMIPVYVAEMAVRKEDRGRGVNAMIACASAGTALAYWTDFGMVFRSGQVVWRFPVAFQIFWALLTIGTIYFNPDTPRYYYAKSLHTEADVLLCRLYTADISDPVVDEARKDILASLELERASTASLRIKDFFWDTSDVQAARRIRTGVILVGLAYLIGTNMIFYYMTVIFQSYIGLAPLTASGLSGAACTILAIANLVGVAFMEKLGRRTWLMGGAVGLSVFMAAFIGCLANPGTKTGAAAAAMLFLWIVCFAPTWGPVTYVYASEIMPLRYRHLGFALSVSSQWIMAFITVFAGPIAIADPQVGWKTWFWFLVFSIAAVPYVYFCCPETRGRSLEEIDLIFMSESAQGSAAARQLEHSDVASFGDLETPPSMEKTNERIVVEEGVSAQPQLRV